MSDVYSKAQAKYEHESNTFAAIGSGDNDEAGYRARLIELGCTFEE